MLQRIVAVLAGIVLLVGALVFASLALGILLAVGLVAWAWLWWRTRGVLPKERRHDGGAVVEGEYRDITSSEHLEDLDPGRRP